MSDYLKYNGYYGSIEFNENDHLFHGKIIGIHDIVTYDDGMQGVENLELNFRGAVDDYIATCEELDIEPQKVELDLIGCVLHKNELETI